AAHPRGVDSSAARPRTETPDLAKVRTPDSSSVQPEVPHVSHQTDGSGLEAGAVSGAKASDIPRAKVGDVEAPARAGEVTGSKGSDVTKAKVDEAGQLLDPDGVFMEPKLEEKYQKYLERKARTGQTPRDRLNWKEASDYWTKESPMARGNRFNKTVQDRGTYPATEVNLENGKRLDSYDPYKGEIISRKATDLDKIQESTFRDYLSEFQEKYARGTKIRSNTNRFVDGQKLEGKYILEIPASNTDIPNIQHYKDIASEYDVTLRFTEE
ncbi:hypothetical protein ACVR0S_09695, partial [Streptococcus dentapri]